MIKLSSSIAVFNWDLGIQIPILYGVTKKLKTFLYKYSGSLKSGRTHILKTEQRSVNVPDFEIWTHENVNNRLC